MPAVHHADAHYAGHRFRSRLQARWAVFFDALDIRWEYERDAYVLPSGCHQPDFLLHLASGPVWFEARAAKAPIDQRWEELGDVTGMPVYVARGMPRLSELGVVLYEEHHICQEWPFWDCDYAFCICRCGNVGIEFDGQSAQVCGGRCYPNADDVFGSLHPRLLWAYRCAHAARFEVSR